MSTKQFYSSSARVREAVPADASAIAQLLRQTDRMHAELRPDLFQTPGPAPAQVIPIGDALGSTDTTFLVAEEAGAVVGVAELRVMSSPAAPVFRPSRKAFVTNLVVDQDRRSQGIGSQLVTAILSWAADRSLDRIEVNVYAINSRAAQFYERAGFAVQSHRLELRLSTAT